MVKKSVPEVRVNAPRLSDPRFDALISDPQVEGAQWGFSLDGMNGTHSRVMAINLEVDKGREACIRAGFQVEDFQERRYY